MPVSEQRTAISPEGESSQVFLIIAVVHPGEEGDIMNGYLIRSRLGLCKSAGRRSQGKIIKCNIGLCSYREVPQLKIAVRVDSLVGFLTHDSVEGMFTSFKKRRVIECKYIGVIDSDPVIGSDAEQGLLVISPGITGQGIIKGLCHQSIYVIPEGTPEGKRTGEIIIEIAADIIGYGIPEPGLGVDVLQRVDKIQAIA